MLDEADDYDISETTSLLYTYPPPHITNYITTQPNQQLLTNQLDRYNTSKRIARLNENLNKITQIISNQYNQSGDVDLLLWNDSYYTYNTGCILEYCYECCCCINYNPNYKFDYHWHGYGRCCGIDIYQESNYYIGWILCFIPCLPLFPIWLIDLWYRKTTGYSRIGFCEWIGNYVYKCCVCKCWEKHMYLNISLNDMEDVYYLVKEKYTNILEVQLKKYSNNIKSISIRST